MIFDVTGDSKKALGKFVNVAEKQGYILVASNKIHDSISISQNILITERMLKEVSGICYIKNHKQWPLPLIFKRRRRCCFLRCCDSKFGNF